MAGTLLGVRLSKRPGMPPNMARFPIRRDTLISSVRSRRRTSSVSIGRRLAALLWRHPRERGSARNCWNESCHHTLTVRHGWNFPPPVAASNWWVRFPPRPST